MILGSVKHLLTYTSLVDITIKTNDGSTQPVSVYLFKPETRGKKGSMKIGNAFHTAKGTSNEPFSAIVDGIQPWTPDTPTLYPMTVQVGNDIVRSYVGFRTISKGVINGVQRPLLNGKFVFQIGTLDQGFWPDGIYSPPSVEAMRFDLVKLKEIGYNMVRKHVSAKGFVCRGRVNWLTRCHRSKLNPRCGTRPVTSSASSLFRICHP